MMAAFAVDAVTPATKDVVPLPPPAEPVPVVSAGGGGITAVLLCCRITEPLAPGAAAAPV